MTTEYEDDDGGDVPMIPISQVKCCGEWVGDQLVYTPLEWVEKILPTSGKTIGYWQCPVCKGGW